MKMQDTSTRELEDVSARVRGKLVELSHRTQTPHLGSSLSCTDLLVALYWRFIDIDPDRPEDPSRDRFILSKGHAAPTLFTCLAFRGFISDESLMNYNQPGQYLAEHPSPQHIPGVEAATGSLGHGLSLGLGMAYAAQRNGQPFDVFAVLSDGECNEGSTWEAAQLAPSKQLTNVIALIDYNKWQATGRSQSVLEIDPLTDKWASFGWHTQEIDGHDMDQIVESVGTALEHEQKPSAIVAHTVKGKGVSFMEDDNNWHYRKPSAEEVRRAHEELGLESNNGNHV